MPRSVLRRLPFSSAGREARASFGTVLWTLAVAACIALLPRQAAAQAVSSAETLLFETDHLARIKPPAVLVYEFRKESNVEPGFSDKVQLDLAFSKGKTSATLHFLSGTHKHDIPALEEAHGNPVLLGFLERDIAEMKRLTGGSTAYFRKRIRMALAEGAQVSPQSIRYQGKSLPAQAVRIQPYLNDPMHARFESYVHKTYVFVVSDQVPGGIYQVRSSLDNDKGKAVDATGPASAGTSAASAKGAAAVGTAPDSMGTSAAPAKGAPAAGAAPGSTAPALRPGQPMPAIEETLTLVSVTQPGH
jgi:hypothetical protein